MKTSAAPEEDVYAVVTRHPAAGREVRAFGGPALFRGKEVLDIGTGDGRLALDVARMARRVVGIDPNPEAVTAAKRNAALSGLANVDVRAGDATRSIVGRPRFDVAIFSWSL